MNTTEPALVPDDSRYGPYHAFTLSPDPSKFHSYDPVVQYEQLLACVFRYKPLKRTLHGFVFYPELNANGNVHLHGAYFVKNKYSYHRWFLPACKKWGFVLVKNKRVDEDWDEYMSKDSFDMSEIFHTDEIGQRMPFPICKKTLRHYHIPNKALLRPSTMAPKMKRGNVLKMFNRGRPD